MSVALLSAFARVVPEEPIPSLPEPEVIPEIVTKLAPVAKPVEQKDSGVGIASSPVPKVVSQSVIQPTVISQPVIQPKISEPAPTPESDSSTSSEPSATPPAGPEPEPVIPPKPPEPSSAWPNEPAGYSLLSLQTFSANIPAGENLPISDGWRILWNSKGNGTSASDPSAPASDSKVFSVLYPQGFGGGSAPATAFYPVDGKKNLFMGTWWKANAGWQGHESNVNKLEFIFLSENSDIYLTTYGSPGGPYELRVCLQFKTAGGDERCWLKPNMSLGVISFGDWHRIEWLIEISEDNTKGVIKWWLDGVLVGSYSDVKFPPGATIAEYKLSPTWGGVNDSKKQNDYFWFDEVYLSTK